MGFKDFLATVVNGMDRDIVNDNHLTSTSQTIIFSKAGQRLDWCNFTRRCMSNKKVWDELLGHEHVINKELEDLQELYDCLIDRAKATGLNAGIFDASIPVATNVHQRADEDEQVEQLVESKGSFSTSCLVESNIATQIGNAHVVSRAQKEQIAIDEQKVAATISQSKVERCLKTLSCARTALEKHQQTPAAMRDKDWVDFIRWLGASRIKHSGLMKDLMKWDASIAKLESLEQH